MTDRRPSGTRADGGGVVAALPWIALVVIVVLPPFLLGALAVNVRQDLAFGPAALGLSVAWFFVATSLSSTTMGQIVERLGVKAGLLMGSIGSACALAGLGLARSFGWVLVAMTAGGLANAATQPSVNAALSRSVVTTRLGLAFGLKQAAIPAATLLAGLAVPAVAATAGWRAAFGLAALLAVTAAVLVGCARAQGLVLAQRSRRRMRDLAEKRSLTLLGFGGLLAAAGASSLGVFLVDSAVSSGIDQGRAGFVVAGASGAGILARVGLGWYADTHLGRSRYGIIALLLAIAAPGYVLLTVPSSTAYAIGALLGYLAGWSWPGLFHYAVVSQNPVSPAAATGLIQTGLSMGAGIGPLIFGAVAEQAGYDTAWIMAGLFSAAGAGVVLMGRSHLRRTRRRASEAHIDELRDLAWEQGTWLPLCEGVDHQQHATANLDVRFFRLQPGAQASPPMADRTGIVLVLGGGEVELQVGGAGVVAGPDGPVRLPSNRPWYLQNNTAHTTTVAQLRHRGNTAGVS